MYLTYMHVTCSACGGTGTIPTHTFWGSYGLQDRRYPTVLRHTDPAVCRHVLFEARMAEKKKKREQEAQAATA